MIESEVVSDLIIKTIALKIKAMEDEGNGLFSETGITSLDRVVVIMNVVRPEHYDKLMATEPSREDINAVVKIFMDTGISLGKEEVVILAKLRNFIRSKIEKNGLTVFLSKYLDVEELKVPEWERQAVQN
ncbi:MAG: hypothetical protein QW290_02670 [Sulfolobales archaeon]